MVQGVQVVEAAEKEEITTVSVGAQTSLDERFDPVICDRSVDGFSLGERFLPGPLALGSEASALDEWLMRALDIVGSVVILLAAAPVMLVIAILLKITSSGSVLYGQARVGKNGKVFPLYKFRTMIDNAEQHSGPVWATRDDPRVTRIGRILRRTRLDELPQLFCVLRNHMSLVGPRPERPYFVGRYKALQGMRLAVKPGLTGLAQVRSYYNLKPEHKTKYDQLYIQNRSFLLNLYILIKTIPVLFTNRGW